MTTKSTALTPRQEQVLALLSEGLSNRDIGERLGISEQAVKAVVSRLLARFHVRNRASLVRARIGETHAADRGDGSGDSRGLSDAGIVVFDVEGHVLFMNDRGSAMAGTFDERRSLQEQMAYYPVRDPETRRPLEPPETPVGRALAGETVPDGRFLIRLPGSQSDTLLRTNATPLRDGQGRVTGVIALFWQEPARSS